MTYTEIRAKEFILKCADQAREINPDPSVPDFHYQLILQLVGKVFELEGKINAQAVKSY